MIGGAEQRKMFAKCPIIIVKGPALTTAPMLAEKTANASPPFAPRQTIVDPSRQQGMDYWNLGKWGHV